MTSRLRAAAPIAGLIAVFASLGTPAPAIADDSAITIAAFSAGWDAAGVAGSWVPFTAEVRNDGARDFTGTVRFRPHRIASYTVGVPGATYDVPVVIPRGAARAVTAYGLFDDFSYGGGAGGSSYEAVVLDQAGGQVAASNSVVLNSGYIAVGLLTDSDRVEGSVTASPRALFGTQVKVRRLTAATLPRDPIRLSGFAALVIDQFDASALSQAQVQAIVDYIAYGGYLIEAGGSTWRRTMAQLPATLLPMRPESSTVVTLGPVAELLGKTSPTPVPAVTGSLRPGASIVLSDSSGAPLMIGASYGAGRILELAFDPADDADLAAGEVAGMAWADAINYGAGRGPLPITATGNGVSLQQPGIVKGIPSRTNLEAQVSALLNDTPENALPPIAGLGLLLVLYILLVGPLNYVLLRGMRRRELMWVSVPLVVAVFTGGAYVQGLLTHGADFFVNEVQLIRAAPDGSADVSIYDAVYAPRRGDVHVRMPEGTLASTELASGYLSGGPVRGSDDRVTATREPQVIMTDVPVWSPRAIRSETSTTSNLQLESHLRLVGGRVVGTILNRGRQAIHDVAVVTGGSLYASLTAMIPAGASADVDASLGSSDSTQGGRASCPPGALCAQPDGPQNAQGSGGGQSPAQKRRQAAQMAGQLLTANDAGTLALVGTMEPLPPPRVEGSSPNRSAVAGFAIATAFESMDALPLVWSAPRILASGYSASTPVAVSDVMVPPALASDLVVKGSASRPGTVVELYDWVQRSWIPFDPDTGIRVNAAQRGSGIIRVRYTGAANYMLQLTSP